MLKIFLLILWTVCFLFLIKISSVIAQQWEFLGLEGEMITSIVVDPREENIIYVGSIFNGNLFRTMDAGSTWDTLLTKSVFHIVMHPDNPNILYVIPPILKTIDGGATWLESKQGIGPFEWVFSLAIDPKDPDVLYAGTRETSMARRCGPYKSIDGGNFGFPIDIPDSADVLESGITAIAIDPHNIATVYMATDWRGDIMKTTDGGRSWEWTGLYRREN